MTAAMDMYDYCDLDENLCKTCSEPECSHSLLGQQVLKRDTEVMTYSRYMQQAGWCRDCEYYAARHTASPAIVVHDKRWTVVYLVGVCVALALVILLAR